MFKGERRFLECIQVVPAWLKGSSAGMRLQKLQSIHLPPVILCASAFPGTTVTGASFGAAASQHPFACHRAHGGTGVCHETLSRVAVAPTAWEVDTASGSPARSDSQLCQRPFPNLQSRVMVQNKAVLQGQQVL